MANCTCRLLLAGALALGGCVCAPDRAATAQPVPPSAPSAAQIVVDRDGAMLTIRPTYTLPDTAGVDTTALRYELTVERTGASTSRTRQSGQFAPVPGRTDTLSTARINADPGDHLRLHLVVRRGADVVASATHTDTVAADE